MAGNAGWSVLRVEQVRLRSTGLVSTGRADNQPCQPMGSLLKKKKKSTDTFLLINTRDLFHHYLFQPRPSQALLLSFATGSISDPIHCPASSSWACDNVVASLSDCLGSPVNQQELINQSVSVVALLTKLPTRPSNSSSPCSA